MRPSRPLLTICLALALAGCGRSPSVPTDQQTLSGNESVSGMVVGLQDRRPVAGANVTISPAGLGGVTASLATRSGSDGAFAFSSVAGGMLQLSIEAPGYVTRQVWLPSDARNGVTIDMIADVAPFSLQFYRDYIRNALDAPTRLQPIKRWSIAPSFYINTRLPSGEDVPALFIQAIIRVIAKSVPELSAGRFKATIDTGTSTRPFTYGWVNVQIVPADALGANTRGSASVGGNTGTMNLEYDPVWEASYQTDYPFHCEGGIVEVADHEMTHVMGFYHSGDGRDLQSGPGCPGAGRSERATYHAAIMYSRPKGNTDRDMDPLIVSTSGAITESSIISCSVLVSRPPG